MPEIQYESPITKGDAGARIDQMDDATPDDEKERIAKILKDFKDDQTYRKPYDHNWDRWRRYHGGDQWFNKLRPAWKARPTPNYVFAAIEQTVPMMLSERPTINVVGKERKDEEAADLMQDAIHTLFAKPEMFVTEVLVLKDGHIYGTGISKQWYNDLTKEVCCTQIDCRWFFVSAGALSIQQAQRLTIARNCWVSTVVKDFPEYDPKSPQFKGKKIEPGVIDDSLTHKPVDTIKMYEQDRTFVMSDQGAMTGLGDNYRGTEEQPVVTLLEIWDRDDTGQVWQTILAGNCILRRRKSPYKFGRADWQGGSRYPFARNLCYPISSQFWGMGEVAQLESPQDSINRTSAQISDLARMCTSPYMRIHKRSRISLKDISNRIMSYIVWDGDHPPDYLPPPGVNEHLFTIVDREKLHMDNLSGIHDATRGDLPEGKKISGVAIQSLQAGSSTRVALKTAMFEGWLKEVAQQSIWLMQQFYQNRTLRTQDGYIDINRIMTDEAEIQAAVAEHGKRVAIKQMNGQDVGILNDIQDCDFDVEIGVGSSLPVDKGVRFEQYTTLRKMGDMSRRAVLRASGVPKEEVDTVLEEINQEKVEDAQVQLQIQQMAQQMQAEAAAQAQASQGAAPPPGGPGSPASGQGGAPSPGAAPPASNGGSGGGGPMDDLESKIMELEGAGKK